MKPLANLLASVGIPLGFAAMVTHRPLVVLLALGMAVVAFVVGRRS